MTCAQCGEREAIVFIRRSGAAKGCDIALCENCANRRGIIAGKGALELNIDDLISTGLEAGETSGAPAACPDCGLELVVLRREGRLGCASCADSFPDEIVKAIGRGAVADVEQGRLFPRKASSAKTVEATQAQAADPVALRLRLTLESAIQAEDYEGAARLRDELAHREASRATGDLAQGCGNEADFPLSPEYLAAEVGPDDDVVLFSSAFVYRDLVGLPFPGSPRGPSAPSRSLLLGRFLSLGSWRSRTMAEIGPVGRRSLSERGIVPRSYAADDEAVLLSSLDSRAYALLDDGDHLRVRAMVPGLDAESAFASALVVPDRLGEEMDFAHRPGIGWICSRLSDCGLGSSLAAVVHIPALAAAGMRDRLFRALLSEGLAIRGYYSAREESAGSLYEIGIDSSRAGSERSLADSFSSAMAKVVAAERRARREISERGRAPLTDAEGRAFGITRYFGLAGAEEAASLLSVLRLAALRGSLSGSDPRTLGGLLTSLGPGSVAFSSGLKEIPTAASLEAYRAGMIKEALARAEYRNEEGA